MNTRVVVDTKIRTYFNLGYFAKFGKQMPQTTCKQDHTFFLQTHFCKASGCKEALWPGSNWMVCSCFSHVQWKWWVRYVVDFKVLLRRTKFLIWLTQWLEGGIIGSWIDPVATNTNIHQRVTGCSQNKQYQTWAIYWSIFRCFTRMKPILPPMMSSDKAPQAWEGSK